MAFAGNPVFIELTKCYRDIAELTPAILNEFIPRIEVHAPEKVDGKRTQRIDIYYNAVGVIDIPTPEELEALKAEHAAQKQQKTQSA